jgi:hypothetical protein
MNLLRTGKIALCAAEGVAKLSTFATTPYHDFAAIRASEMHSLVARLYETTTTRACRHLDSCHFPFSPIQIVVR